MLRLAALLIIGLSGSAVGSEGIETLLADYQHATGVPVSGLDNRGLARLRSGEVIYRKVSVSERTDESESTSMRIIGYRLIDKPRETLWLSALAYDAGFSPRLTEHLLDVNDTGTAAWYQHLDMPWPLRDRHWVVQSEKNLALANDSDGQLWEHRWSLVPDAGQRITGLFEGGPIGDITPAKASKSVRLPLNNGAWMMASTSSSSTLVVVHATVDMGGIVPDSIVARQTRKNLSKMLRKIENDADTAWSNYTDRYLIYRGDGTLIEPHAESPQNSD